jgi:hypothetical protein
MYAQSNPYTNSYATNIAYQQMAAAQNNPQFMRNLQQQQQMMYGAHGGFPPGAYPGAPTPHGAATSGPPSGPIAVTSPAVGVSTEPASVASGGVQSVGQPPQASPPPTGGD